MEKYICQFCKKECKNLNSLRQHEIRCKLNPNRKVYISNFIKYNNDVKNGIIQKLYTNQFTKAKELNLPIPIVSDKTKVKIGKAWRGKTHTEEEKQKISEGIRKAIKEHPESYSSMNVNGRVKQYEYNGIKLDGKWEFDVAKYLDSQNIKWERPNKGIEYIWENSTHLYFPDFYLPEYNMYIEVKGYQRNRDLYKWNSIQNLIIIKQQEILKIRNNTYNIMDYLK